MDYEYLKEVLEIRKQEIQDGKNLATAKPVYVVMDMTEHIIEGHSGYIHGGTNMKGKNPEYGYMDLDIEPEDREFCESEEGMKSPEEITRIWTDRPIAFFLTSEGAHSYLDYQSHNIDDGYVYVFTTGYRNMQMDRLLKEEL